MHVVQPKKKDTNTLTIKIDHPPGPPHPPQPDAGPAATGRPEGLVMTISYAFNPGQRVRHKWQGTEGEVTTCVPGNGTIPWHFVRWDDGVEDRHTADELEPTA